MPYNEQTYVYDPLDRRTFEAIAYNAIGRGSETNTYPAYRLTHSSGQSGWSVGFMQWDFGQRGRGHKVPELLDGYQKWAAAGERFTASEVASLTRRLQTPGQHGNALSEAELARLNGYLRSDAGRSFVNGLDQEQIAYKWENVGRPLASIQWLQAMRRSDPEQAAEIVAMTAKRFNQGEARGREMIRHLQAQETTSSELASWVDTVSARAPANRAALLSGRDNALTAVRLLNDLETGDGAISRAWRQQIHGNGNVGLSQHFGKNPDVQLLDVMMRNPVAGRAILHAIEAEARPGRVVISGINASANAEMARVELSRAGELSVQAPGGRQWVLAGRGWEVRAPQRQEQAAPSGSSSAPGDTEQPVGSQRAPAANSPRDRLSRADAELLDQVVEGIALLDRAHGRESDAQREPLSYALLGLAKANGLTAVDHVVISVNGPGVNAGENIFVVQGGLKEPTNRVAYMRTEDALQAQPAEVLSRIEALERAAVQTRDASGRQESQMPDTVSHAHRLA